ncbi:hypothetical protein D3C87_1634740 [compost metagenome]
MAFLRFHPLLQVLDGGLDISQHDEKLGEQRLEGGAVAVVLVDRFDQCLAVVFQHPRQLLEVFHALGIAALGRGEVGGALVLEAGLHGGGNDGLGNIQGTHAEVLV